MPGSFASLMLLVIFVGPSAARSLLVSSSSCASVSGSGCGWTLWFLDHAQVLHWWASCHAQVLLLLRLLLLLLLLMLLPPPLLPLMLLLMHLR